MLGDALLFALLEFEQDVFLGREMEEEGAVGDARRSDDRADVCLGHTRALELGDGGSHQSLAGLQTLGFSR